MTRTRYRGKQKLRIAKTRRRNKYIRSYTHLYIIYNIYICITHEFPMSGRLPSVEPKSSIQPRQPKVPASHWIELQRREWLPTSEILSPNWSGRHRVGLAKRCVKSVGAQRGRLQRTPGDHPKTVLVGW